VDRGRIRRRGALCALAAAAIAGPASSQAAQPALRVEATNLDNPRKLFSAGDGTVYVAEAGSGGSDRCFGTGPNATCVGLSGGVAAIVNGRVRRVVTGLPSWAEPSAAHASGPAAVLVRGRTFYVLVQDGLVQPSGRNALGPDGKNAGKLIATPAGRVRATALADFGAYEAAHNPDRGAGPGQKLGNPVIDSDPYAVVRYRGGFAVADAGANDLLWVSPNGTVSVLAVFPTQTVKLTKAVAAAAGLPTGLRSIAVQSVPDSVAVGPDGALYVGELTGRPFPRGGARVWRVAPGRKPTVYASGFTSIADLAFDGRDLLVLEIAAKGLADPKLAGALVRVAPGGRRTTLVGEGLTAPTGVATAGGRIYISDCGVCPAQGPGPHGRLVSIATS
jgi:hypothetical protein